MSLRLKFTLPNVYHDLYSIKQTQNDFYSKHYYQYGEYNGSLTFRKRELKSSNHLHIKLFQFISSSYQYKSTWQYLRIFMFRFYLVSRTRNFVSSREIFALRQGI